MKSIELLNEFESIVLINTIFDRIDRNFLDKSKLEEIEEISFELDINLSSYDLSNVYNSQYTELDDIYNIWAEELNTLYLKSKQKLMEKLECLD